MAKNELEEDGTERHVDDSRVHQSFGDELSENLEDLGLNAITSEKRSKRGEKERKVSCSLRGEKDASRLAERRKKGLTLQQR